MKQLNIKIPENLHFKVKVKATQQKTTVTDVILKKLEDYLKE